ncbi:MAG: T9SS type A sorting domain-containing protein [Ignavibacteriales bacterium]|nr:T9SS type A sorting domain-containing protein [Ignavibacteriales bacterium]
MKSFKIYLPILFFVFTISFAQTKLNMQKVDESALSNGESYPVDARESNEAFDKANGIDYAKLGQPIQTNLKKVAWNFTVGSIKSWIVSDRRPGTSTPFYPIPTTCRAASVGSNCYIFVADSVWGTRVTQTAVDQIRIAFDSQNAVPNSNKGIFQTDKETYGDPPDVDHDTKIIILIFDILDSYSVTHTGGYTVGYFHPINEYSKLQYSNSNEAEMFFLDANPLDISNSSGLITGLSTLAHEFQHMIQYNYHGMLTAAQQETFFDEGCSLVAEVINGYPLYSQSSYYNISTNRYMLGWNPNNDATDVIKDYSRAARFFLYLKEQFGVGVLKSFTQSTRTGINALNIDALPAVPTSRRFSDIVVDWWIANFLNDRNVDTKWGYIYPNVPKVPATTMNADPNVTYKSDAVYKLGAEYISYISGNNLTANFNTNGKTALQLRAIETGPAGKKVSVVTPGSNFTEPNFGTDYTNVTFLVCHNDNNDAVLNPNSIPFAYSYTSSGTNENKPTEIAYDNTEPTGIWNWPAGDSVAVVFDGIPGTKLDSIRVALRTLSSINGGVWRKATSGSALFGKQLAVPITATGKTYVSGTYPPQWTNWVKVDLRNYNIDASTSFVVSFVLEGTYQIGVATGPNRIMNTYQPSSNSLTYTTNNDVRKWYNFTVDDTNPQDSLIVYLIRAYVSLPTGVKDVIELMPSSFKLAQNYPNPFNPSTVISYQLPVSGQVSLKVYDMLGREVATLVNEFQQAGNHNSQFSISNSQLSSGIYFYTIRSGNFVETKKMVLMK